jgi:hypothetical protein
VSQSKKRIYLIFVSVILALTIVAFVDIIVTSQSSGTALVAFKLEETPGSYFVIEDPDSYFLKAVDNEGESIFLGLFGETNIDELTTFHNTNNVSYLDDFYVVYSFSVDAFSFGPYLLHAAIISCILLIVYWFISKALKT